MQLELEQGRQKNRSKNEESGNQLQQEEKEGDDS
jgi:hypothetical protein